MPEAPFSRRPSPLMLVIPIILTLAGVGLSVTLYLDLYGKDKGKLALEESARQDLQRVRKEHRALLAREADLRAVLGYAGDDYLDWLRGRLGDYADFKRAMEARRAEVRRLQGQVGTLEGELKSLADQVAQANQAKRRLIEAKRAEITRKLEDLANIDKGYTPHTTERLERINELGRALMEKDELRKRVTRQRLAEKRRQDQNLITIQLQVERLEDATSDKRSIVQHVDGTILTVEAGTDRVIVDLGRRNRLLPGMRFKVVEKGKVTPDPNNPAGPYLVPRSAEVKGEIEIVSVGETQSTAVVLDLDFSRPILPGDAIFNPGYSPDYQTRFVLVGKLDLNGDGRHDGELVRQLIKEIGGVVQEKVDVRTDFLLVGTEWPTDDPVSRKRYYRDREQIKAAENLDVSFLSVRRFLDYLGVRIGLDGVPRPLEAGL